MSVRIIKILSLLALTMVMMFPTRNDSSAKETLHLERNLSADGRTMVLVAEPVFCDVLQEFQYCGNVKMLVTSNQATLIVDIMIAHGVGRVGNVSLPFSVRAAVDLAGNLVDIEAGQPVNVCQSESKCEYVTHLLLFPVSKKSTMDSAKLSLSQSKDLTYIITADDFHHSRLQLVVPYSDVVLLLTSVQQAREELRPHP